MPAPRRRLPPFTVLCCTGLCLLAVPHFRAASFDCAKAQRPVEKVICGDVKLNAADESLGRTYRATLSNAPPRDVGELRRDQVEWLVWVQEICQADAAGRPAATTAQCMRPVYEERAKLLRAAFVQRNGMTFLTRTRYIAAPEPKQAAMGVPDFPGFGTLQVSWPEAAEAPAAWSAWNHAVVMKAYLLSGGGQGSLKKPLSDQTRWTPDLAQGQDATVTLRVKSVEHGRVSTTMTLSSMGHGAAHPNEAFATLTWLLDQSREMRAEDLFAPSGDWKAKVAAICWTQILKGRGQDAVYQEVTGPGAKPLQADIADVSNWTLEPDGLHISYPEYTISARASPIDDAVIPWAQLKPLLAQGFVTP